MDIEFLTFVDIEIDKPKLGYPKSLTSIYGVDMNKIVESDRVSFVKKGFKYFNGYKNVKKRPLLLMLPKMSAYKRNFDEPKYMTFL